MLDYVIHYVRNGRKTSAKIFKWTTLDIAAGEIVILTKSHSMRIATVRALYLGTHKVELQVNGTKITESSFEQTKPN
jgi:hypothetical protein